MASGDLVIFSDAIVPLLEKLWWLHSKLDAQILLKTDFTKELLESNDIQAQHLTSKLKNLMQSEKKILNIST